MSQSGREKNTLLDRSAGYIVHRLGKFDYGRASQSDIFVVIVSRDSIYSPEVTKEITGASRTCRYILPFKIDDEVLSDRMRYHLGPCHWLDAICPPLEQRINELVHRIEHLSDEDAIYMNRECISLSERVFYPCGSFLGRDSEIEEVLERLSDNHILFLEGIGGIGKSEIAKAYAKKYRNQPSSRDWRCDPGKARPDAAELQRLHTRLIFEDTGLLVFHRGRKKRALSILILAFAVFPRAGSGIIQ